MSQEAESKAMTVGEAPGVGPDKAPTPSSRSRRRQPSRAGRNLAAAVAVGLGLGTLILGSLFVVKELFVGLVIVTIVLAMWELTNALASKEIRPPTVPLAIGAVAILVAAYAGGAEPLVVAFALTATGVVVWRLADGPEGFLRDVTAGVFVVAYVPLLAAFSVMLLVPDDGPRRVFTFFFVTACSDTGGYVAGVLLGRHPMAPAISPKKSWEGLAGSLVIGTVGGAAALTLLLGGTWWHGAVVGVAVVFSATLGDLGESMIKRDLGIKDMGTLLPGHGGIMDRLDSLLPTAPVVWALLTLFVPAT